VKIINVYEARAQLSRLLDEAEAGEEIIIARHGTPVVQLVPVRAATRRLGRWQGKVQAPSDEQWRAADEEIAEMFEDSRR
jgi:prevent-host-death family protein